MPGLAQLSFLIYLALLSSLLPAHARADFRADSLALIGSWQWAESGGGMLGAWELAPSSWGRVLTFFPGGRYAFWEWDSVSTYVVCSGSFTLHPSSGRIEGGTEAFGWAELENWWQPWELKGRFLIGYRGRNEITMYPGSGNVGVSDALTHVFRRRARGGPSMPPMTSASGGGKGVRQRPPRIRVSNIGASIDLPSALWKLVSERRPFIPWFREFSYPPALIDRYRYTHFQIPAAVIGDFDGDRVLDAALHGCSEEVHGVIHLLLSNRGTALALVEETEVLGPPPRGNRPTHCLELYPRGRVIRTDDGTPDTLATDAILLVWKTGVRSVRYLSGGKLLKGTPMDDGTGE